MTRGDRNLAYEVFILTQTEHKPRQTEHIYNLGNQRKYPSTGREKIMEQIKDSMKLGGCRNRKRWKRHFAIIFFFIYFIKPDHNSWNFPWQFYSLPPVTKTSQSLSSTSAILQIVVWSAHPVAVMKPTDARPYCHLDIRWVKQSNLLIGTAEEVLVEAHGATHQCIGLFVPKKPKRPQ